MNEVVAWPAHPCFDKDDEEELFNTNVKPTLNNRGVFSHRGIDYDILANDSFDDDQEYFFVSDSEYGYDLSVGFNKDIGVMQINHVCKNPDSDRKGLPSSVYLDYLLPMEGELVSDLTQTADAFKFWKNLFRKVSKLDDVYFYAVDVENPIDNKLKYVDIENVTDMDYYYGKDSGNEFHQNYAFSITDTPRKTS